MWHDFHYLVYIVIKLEFFFSPFCLCGRSWVIDLGSTLSFIDRFVCYTVHVIFMQVLPSTHMQSHGGIGINKVEIPQLSI